MSALPKSLEEEDFAWAKSYVDERTPLSNEAMGITLEEHRNAALPRRREARPEEGGERDGEHEEGAGEHGVRAA